MKKIIFSFIALCLVGSSSYAQQDSSKNSLRFEQNFFADSITIAEFHFSKHPLLISASAPKVSRISLGHQLNKGNFIPAQGSSKTNQLFLSSEGTAQLNGIRLYGSFSYQKSTEDSTRFAHQTRNNPSTPYYFASPAANHYERSTYHFNALGAKNFLNDKLIAGLGFEYLIADHFSNNDPRGSIKEYQINTKLALGYQLTSHVLVGAALNLGYGSEEVNIGYKNRLYFESTFFPRYVNYLVNGYGEPEPKTSTDLRKYRDLQSRVGFDVALKITDLPLGSLMLKTTQTRERQNYERRTSYAILPLTMYTLDKLVAELLWTKQFNAQQRLSINATYLSWDGEDLNSTFQAKNYVYTKLGSNLTVNYGVAKEKTTFLYTLGAGTAEEERLDGITGNKIYFKNLVLKTVFGVQQKLKSQHAVGASIGLHYRKNLDQTFSVNEVTDVAPSNFTKTVIYHDYLYHTATGMGASLSFDYRFPFLKTTLGALRFGAVYSANEQMKTFSRTALSIPGKDVLSTNVSLNLYF